MLLLCCPLSRSVAVELRNTVGSREVVRQVSFIDPLQTEAPASLGDDSMIVEPLPYEGDLLVYDDGATPCTACGVQGCSMDCLVPHRKWARFDYLLWWRKGMPLPALAITSSDDTELNNLRLGLDTTTILYGNERVGTEARPGGRVSIGLWLDDCENCGVEGRFFSLGRQTSSFNAASDGNVPLGRPFTNVIPNPNVETSRTLAFPGFNTDGSVNVTSTSDLLGGDVLYRMLGCGYPDSRWYLLAGYQYARLEEDLLISDSTVITAQDVTQAITDRFDTRNEYHAASVGFAYERFHGCWQFDVLAKVGFGNMSQTVNIAGTTTNTDATGNSVMVSPPQGLLALENQGRFSQDKFSVSPEINLNAAYSLNECVQLSLGYSFIYWSSVAQAGAHIPANLEVPSPFAFNDTSYWAHGLNAGLEFQF